MIYSGISHTSFFLQLDKNHQRGFLPLPKILQEREKPDYTYKQGMAFGLYKAALNSEIGGQSGV